MPQFDLSCFFVQYFWLLIYLIVTYTLLCVYFLPVTCKYIKSRRQIFSIPELEVLTYLSIAAEKTKQKTSTKLITKFLTF